MFSIYFSGQLVPGKQQGDVAATLQQRMNLSPERTEKLFSGARILIKRDLDQAAAEKYVSAMAAMGAVVEVAPPLPAAAGGNSLSLEPMAAPAEQAAPHDEDENIQPYAPPANPAAVGQVFCRQCGTGLPAVAQHCHQCGAAQRDGAAKSRAVAALLAFLFGWVGGHRLYLGQWWGVLYLLLYPIMWLVSLIEAIVFLCTPKQRWLQKYGNVPANNVWLLAVIGVFGFVFIGGILAAVSIPAYQDYVTRTKVSAAMTASAGIRNDVAAFQLRTGYLPSSNVEIGLEDNSALTEFASANLVDEGRIALLFDGVPSIAEHTLVWQASLDGDMLNWQCDGGSLPDRYRPSQCRGGEGSRSAPVSTSHKTSAPAAKTYRSADQREALTLKGNWVPMEMEDAVMAYINERDDMGVLVVREPLSDFEPGFGLADYQDIALEYNFSELSQLTYEPVEETYINGLPANTFVVSGYINGIAVTFLNAVVETDEHFYRVSTWTGTGDWPRKQTSMYAILGSFDVDGKSVGNQP